METGYPLTILETPACNPAVVIGEVEIGLLGEACSFDVGNVQVYSVSESK